MDSPASTLPRRALSHKMPRELVALQKQYLDRSESGRYTHCALLAFLTVLRMPSLCSICPHSALTLPSLFLSSLSLVCAPRIPHCTPTVHPCPYSHCPYPHSYHIPTSHSPHSAHFALTLFSPLSLLCSPRFALPSSPRQACSLCRGSDSIHVLTAIAVLSPS